MKTLPKPRPCVRGTPLAHVLTMSIAVVAIAAAALVAGCGGGDADDDPAAPASRAADDAATPQSTDRTADFPQHFQRSDDADGAPTALAFQTR